MSRYPKGQPIRLSTTVRDVAGVLVNAGTLTLTIVKPDGSSQTYASPTNDGTGTYHQDVAAADLAQLGYYAYEWVATGTGAGVAPGGFDVFDPLTVASTLYVTLPELRDHLGDTQTGLDAERLEAAAAAASRAIDGYCGRRFWLDPAVTSRRYGPTGPFKILSSTTTYVRDIASTTGLVVATDTAGNGTFATTWTLDTDFELHPLDADADGGAYAWWQLVAIGSKTFPTSGRAGLKVTARHGWSQVPDPIREACKIKAAKLWKRSTSIEGVAGFGEFGVVRISRAEDPDVANLLDSGPYVLHAIA